MRASNKKVLIVSASIGAGHNQAAHAIKSAWEMNYPNDCVDIVDFMAENNSHLNHFIKEVYLKTISVSPNLYETVYRWTQGTVTGTKVQDILSWAMRTSMDQLLRKYQPDAVICTHPFPCGAIAYLKRKRKLTIPIVGIITDFAVHSLWVNHAVDQYIVAASELKDELIQQGIIPSRIYATGIPIHPSFITNNSTYKPASMKPKPCVLIMGGGLGLGPMDELFTHLNRIDLPLEIIAVTGSNTLLREKLAAITVNSPHDVLVMGYTRHMQELMGLADILITKPGALTISEALAMELPMLFYEAIPGQEIDNASFVINKGAASWLGRSEMNSTLNNPIKQQLTNFITNPNELARMQEAAREISHPNSAALAVQVINSQMEPKVIRARSWQ